MEKSSKKKGDLIRIFKGILKDSKILEEIAREIVKEKRRVRSRIQKVKLIK